MENTILLGLLEQHLGKGYKRAHGNYAFICPNCKDERERLGKSKKPKLEIRLTTNLQGENPWNCWYCDNFRGKTLKTLFKKLKLDYNKLTGILKPTEQTETRDNSISLPKEFIPLYPEPNNIYSKKVLNYLSNRNISKEDIIKYNIGYCMDGKYHDRVIMPSYDGKGILNYFEARDITNTSPIRYLKPNIDRNELIGFELFINWNVPIILCEGMFDAIAIKRNVIPLLGKTLSNALMKKIATAQVNKIYLALDNDALKTTLKHAEELMNKGKEVYIVDIKNKDASEMGFESFTKLIQTSTPLTFDEFFTKKLELI